MKDSKKYKKPPGKINDKDFKKTKMKYDNFENSYEDNLDNANNINLPKWYEEFKHCEEAASNNLTVEEIQNLKKEASFIFNDAVIRNKSKAPKSLSGSDYNWVKTVMSKGTKTDKIAAYTLLIQDSPIYNLSLLKNIIETVKSGKNKECFMAVDTLCELFLKDLLPPTRKLLSFNEQPLSKLNELTSGNMAARKKRLLFWYFEDQLKSVYSDFVSGLTKISYDSVEANKQKVISSMFKLLEGNSEMESLLLNNIVNKLGDPSRKVGSKVIYVLMKLLQSHPNMKEVVANAVEKVIFRNNISKRAQYYSVCFLSQFCLFKEDSDVAKKLISIYLSLFKACIKMGNIDSRLMGALLSGVNRAFPYLDSDYNLIKDHINTLFKLVHLSHANISIQALSLLYLISDCSNSCIDRFYSVLYKKIGETELFQSTHHAMLINLLFKALKKDKEKNRICAFIKRLLQVCAYMPVPVACGVLIMISQVIKLKKNVLLVQSSPDISMASKLEEDSDDGEEHYKDITEEVSPDDSSKEDVSIQNHSKPQGNIYNIDAAVNVKVWCNPDKSVQRAQEFETLEYNPFSRNPLYAGAARSLYTELLELIQHFHPTVSLFAHKIIRGEDINYPGDPFLDFTLIRFLEKFSFKNPKNIIPEEERNETFVKFDRKKYYTATSIRRLRANTAEYLKLSPHSIPVDEFFLYKYMKEKTKDNPLKKKDTDDRSDLESVGSDEFDDMLNDLVEGKKDKIDFRSEIGHLLKKDEKKKTAAKKQKDDNLSDESLSDGGSMAEDFDGDEIDDFTDEGEEFEGSELDEYELEASGIKLPKLPYLKKNKREHTKKRKKGIRDDLFAAAEEFSELLEETDCNAGGSEALSNKDHAGAKQLKWESERNKWITKKNYRNKGVKRSHSTKISNKNIKKKKIK